MRFNKEFSLCEVAGRSFLAPTGSKVMDVNKMMDLFLIKLLQENEMTHEQLLEKLLEEYDVDRETAANDLSEFISAAKSMGVIQS